MKKTILPLALYVMSVITLSACQSTISSPSNETDITLGLVQKEVKIGKTSVDILEALGSPNIVKSQSPSDNEVWIYDKIYSSKSSSNIGVGALGGGSDVLALINASNSQTESTSKSLTVIIKFNEHDIVSDVSYLRTSF